MLRVMSLQSQPYSSFLIVEYIPEEPMLIICCYHLVRAKLTGGGGQEANCL